MTKNYLIILILVNSIISCKKEKQPPAELIGRWEDRYSYIERHLGDSVYRRFDTIPFYNRRWIEYRNNFSVITTPTTPNCEGTYQLIRNDKFIELYFSCQVIAILNNGKYLQKIYKLSPDTLILEDTFEDGLMRIAKVKIK